MSSSGSSSSYSSSPSPRNRSASSTSVSSGSASGSIISSSSGGLSACASPRLAWPKSTLSAPSIGPDSTPPEQAQGGVGLSRRAAVLQRLSSGLSEPRGANQPRPRRPHVHRNHRRATARAPAAGDRDSRRSGLSPARHQAPDRRRERLRRAGGGRARPEGDGRLA